MKIISALIIIIFQATLAFSYAPKDTVTATPAVDSISYKVDHLVSQALSNSAEKPLDAIKNYRTALAINTKKTDTWEAGIRTELSRLLIRVKSKDAITQLLKADALYKKRKNVAGRAEAITLLATAYEKSGLFVDAEKTYNDLFKIQREAGEAVLAGNAMNHMADLYLKRENYAMAYKYLCKAEEAYYFVCRKDSLASLYLKVALIKKKQNSPNVAAFYVTNKALPFFSATDNLIGRKQSFSFLGSLYQQQKRYSESKWFYIQANSLARELNDTVGTITSLINLGVVKISIGDMALAKKDLREADLLAKQSNLTYLMKDVKLKYSNMFKQSTPKVPVVSASVKLLGPVTHFANRTQNNNPILFAEFSESNQKFITAESSSPKK